MLREGDRIGDWIVDRCLGEGGMGAVYACHNVLSERIRAAVKLLKGHGLGKSRERFVRELELLASVQHPAVVRVMGGGEDPVRGVLWFAMELIEGESLHDRLQRGPLSWEEASRVFAELGSGLLHAHRMGVTHRDIKPGNIMILPDGSAKLLDFGIAVQQGATRYTRDGLVPGTMAYLPPEVFGGTKPDQTADIYALGQVLWETLTGNEAFPEDPDSSAGENMARLMGRKLQSEPLDVGDAAPESVRALVRKATEPEPEDRLRDLAPFVEVLRSSAGRAASLAPARSVERPLPKPTPKAAKREVPASAPSTFGLDAEPAGDGAAPKSTETPSPSSSRKTRPPAPQRSRLPMFLAGILGAGALLCAGCLGLLMLAPELPDDSASEDAAPEWDMPTVPSYNLGGQKVPKGFPFTVPDDANIIMGARSETDGQVAYNVTYTTGQAPKALIDTYAQEFEARGMTLSRSNVQTSDGTTWTVSGYTMQGEAATASAGKQHLGMVVSVSWVPPR